MQLVLEQRLPQRDLHLPLASVGTLPAVETHRADNLVDVIDYPLDHDGGVTAPGLLEKLSERSLAAIDLLLDGTLALELHHVLRECQQFLEEIDAAQQALLMPVLEVL